MSHSSEQQDYESLKQADKLDRETLIKNLTKILETTTSPFVMSINASWGMGKTTMLRLWKAYLYTQEFQCFYFSAWEHDFGSQPLVALMAQFQIFAEELKNTGKEVPAKALENIISKSKTFIKRAAPLAGKVALKVITRDAVNDKELKDLFATISFDDKDLETLGDGLGEVAKSEIERYVSQQTTLKEFREGLKNFANLVNGHTKARKPMVIFIDELDRCRPNYAIELLETVKHLFSVDGIVFILGVDMEQLGKSASVLYGTQMDTAGYFRRLIDYEFALPLPKLEKFVASLEIITHEQILAFGVQSLPEKVNKTIQTLAKEFHLSVRDTVALSKYYKLGVAITLSKHGANAVNFTLFWLTIKMKFPDTYNRALENLHQNIPNDVDNYSSQGVDDVHHIMFLQPEIQRFLRKPDYLNYEIAYSLIELAVSQQPLSLSKPEVLRDFRRNEIKKSYEEPMMNKIAVQGYNLMDARQIQVIIQDVEFVNKFS